MSNIEVTSRFNESKHQMFVGVTDAGVPPAGFVSNTRIAIFAKETTLAADGFNQVEYINRIKKFTSYLRDYNYLQRAAAGEFPDGIIIYGPLNATTVDEFTVEQSGASRLWYDQVADGDVGVLMPSAAGWVADGSTVYMTNMVDRMLEKIREDFLVNV